MLLWKDVYMRPENGVLSGGASSFTPALLPAACGRAGPVAARPPVGIGFCSKAWALHGRCRLLAGLLLSPRTCARQSIPVQLNPIPLGMRRVLWVPALTWVPGVEGLGQAMSLHRCLQHPPMPPIATATVLSSVSLQHPFSSS